MMLNVIKTSTNIRFNIQREKPQGFSLCCFYRIVLVFLIFILCSNTTYGNKYIQERNLKSNLARFPNKTATADKVLLQDILHGRFSELPAPGSLNKLTIKNDRVAAIGILGHTIRALLKGQAKFCEETYKIATQISANEHTDNYTKIFAHSSKGIIKSYQGAYITSLFSYLNAYRALKSYIEKNQYPAPEIIELAHTFNAILKKIPAEYASLLKIAGITPLILSNLKKNQAGYPELAETIHIFHTAIVEKQSVPLSKANNPVNSIILAHQAIKNKKPQRAIELLSSVDSARNQLNMQFYLLGQAYLNQGNYSKSSWYFTKFLLMREDGSYIKAALLRQKWIAIITGTPISHLTASIEEQGTAYTFTDKQALKENKITYNPKLLESRILFDGGQLSKAINTIKKADFNNLNTLQQTAYYYRKARILQAMGNFQEALKNYKILEAMPNTGHYYHKKAMLETGKILLNLKQYKKARAALQLVSKTESDMYSNSIDQEAEELIEKLK